MLVCPGLPIRTTSLRVRVPARVMSRVLPEVAVQWPLLALRSPSLSLLTSLAIPPTV